MRGFWRSTKTTSNCWQRHRKSPCNRRIKGGKGFQPVIDPNGVKGQNFPVLLGEVNIVRAIGGGAFLFIKDGVVFRTLKLDLGHLVIGQVFVMLDHVLQRGIKLIQRVNFCQIHVAVPDGNIAFLVHVAKIAQFNLILAVIRFRSSGSSTFSASI